ncbi:orotidine-5'-phosphate decarboxylase [Kocuria sp. cx-455]|uniref:orotidine-5'-phosphate decarboxylase n=1 Tax=Kocuria sp. cx-455 TaxID=2771377 RepID=UPI0016820849|nr:orotidine-5'-phosphate decarboxylase [Kocuria sp. cx-455]MBD2765440.1 orotidine-5'-phosphate decarboxylase [Kocuria sp. cx-455]
MAEHWARRAGDDAAASSPAAGAPHRPGATREPFGARLRRAMTDHGPLCVGIDPHPQLLEAWGLPHTVAGLERFSLTVVEAAAGHAATLKPQVALYEAFGSAGMAVLERVLRACREVGVLTIADAKRGDIGSTMAAYATAWLSDDSPLAADAVTLSPYLGFESLRPALDLARQTGRGTFVLALTSNPEGASVQHAGGDESVAQTILRAVREENAHVTAANWENTEMRITRGTGTNSPVIDCDQIVINRGNAPLGSCGVVIGATVSAALSELRIDLRDFNGPILSPGYGAQGADATAVARVFDHVSGNVLANSSRGVLRHGPNVSALRSAMQRSGDELSTALYG